MNMIIVRANWQTLAHILRSTYQRRLAAHMSIIMALSWSLGEAGASAVQQRYFYKIHMQHTNIAC